MAKGFRNYSLLTCLLLQICLYHLHSLVAFKGKGWFSERPQNPLPEGSSNPRTEANPPVQPVAPQDSPAESGRNPSIISRDNPYAQSNVINPWIHNRHNPAPDDDDEDYEDWIAIPPRPPRQPFVWTNPPEHQEPPSGARQQGSTRSYNPSSTRPSTEESQDTTYYGSGRRRGS